MVICFRYGPMLVRRLFVYVSFARCRDVTGKLRPACLTLRCRRNAELDLRRRRHGCDHMRTASVNSVVCAKFGIHNPGSLPTEQEDTKTLTSSRPLLRQLGSFRKGSGRGYIIRTLEQGGGRSTFRAGKRHMRCRCAGTLKGREVPIGFGWQDEREKKSTLCIPERGQAR